MVGVAPYFPEFPPYCETGGLPSRPCATDDASQRVDIDALVRALTDRTAAVIINTPSNPSGHVIEHEEMAAIVDVLEHHNRRTKRRILLVADEAYRNLVYAPARRVEPFDYYEHSVLARSFSKDMGLAGERIGYLALHPSLAGEQTDRGLESCMRALGMVNASATVAAALLYLNSWNITWTGTASARPRTRRRVARDLDVAEPQGGIFLWIRSPWPDTLAYVPRSPKSACWSHPESRSRWRSGSVCFTSTPERLCRALSPTGRRGGRARSR